MTSFNTILSFGSYIVIVILLLEKLFDGSRKIRKENIEELRERNKQLEEKLLIQEKTHEEAAQRRKDQYDNSVKESQTQINKLTADFARMSGTIEEKDKLIKAQDETIKNRNPLLEKVLEANVKTNEENAKTNKAIKELLEAIYKQGAVLSTKTDEQTVMIKAQVKREDGIDKSTDGEVGNIMRKQK